MSISKEKECIKRLLSTQPSFWHDITDWLLQLKLITQPELSTLYRAEERINFMVHKLRELQESEKLILVTYNWVILPNEHIEIYILGEREGKTFEYTNIT